LKGSAGLDTNPRLGYEPALLKRHERKKKRGPGGEGLLFGRQEVAVRQEFNLTAQ